MRFRLVLTAVERCGGGRAVSFADNEELYVHALVQALRLAMGLKPGEQPHPAGCVNVQNNGGRIRVFELSGSIGHELFERVARVLEINPATIKRLTEQDRKECFEKRLARANVPIRPCLVIRLIPAVYCKRAVPSGITSLDEAEAWASSVAVECRRRCCLVWSRKLSSWFDESGELSMRTEAAPDEPNTPWMMVKGKG